jgi:outer membrane receptor protein involved in Fe transport
VKEPELAIRPGSFCSVLAIAALLWPHFAHAQSPTFLEHALSLAGATESADRADPELQGDSTDPSHSASAFDEIKAEKPDSPLANPPEKTANIEKIVVTGERRTNLQEAPISSTSFSAREIKALRIEDIADLAAYTPNLEVRTAFAASNPNIFIRGIGLKDYNANAAGAVGIYRDGININSPAIQLGQLFDIEGIDVLRGPQGSVNGRNATAGAILIRSAKPTHDFGVTSKLTYGNYDDKEVEGSINIPLIKDILSMRISGAARWRDGYTENQCAGWNPEAFGFMRIDQTTNRELYDALQPAGQYENGVLRPVKINRLGSTTTQDRFVYLNHELAQEVRKVVSGVTPGSTKKPFVLAEDLYDANGDLVAASGTPIAAQATTLSLTEVDQICMLRAPGELATLAGEYVNPGNPDFLEGNWRASRLQPGLEDFAGLERWTNNIDKWAARMILLFEPFDNMEWTINAHGMQNRGDSAHLQMLGATSRFGGSGFFEVFEAGFTENNAAVTSGFGLGEGVRNVRGVAGNSQPGEGGGNPYSGFYSEDGIEYLDAWGVNGSGVWDLGAVVMTLLYDYEWYDRYVEEEADANPSRIFPAIWSDTGWQTTEDFRLEGEGERYGWTAGFFFLYEELDSGNLFPDVRQFEIDQRFDQTVTSWAPYMNFEADLVAEGTIPGIYQLTFGAGLRYNNEKKEFALGTKARGTTSGVEIVELPEQREEETWKEWTGDVQLSYTPFSNAYGTLISYLKYGRGFKGGHYNASLTIIGGDPTQDVKPVEPEYVDAVEFGVRTRWLDDRVTLNAAIFRYWYQSLQVFDITNEPAQLPLKRLLNGDAEVLGAEAELRVEPLPGLLISGNLGWLDSEFTEFLVTKTSTRGQGTSRQFNYAGNQLVSAPKWNFAVISKYEFPLFNWGTLIPQWDFNYRSKVYLDPQNIDPISQDGYWLNNLRIAYRTPDNRIELAFWVANLFDEEYKIDTFDLTLEFNSIIEVWSEPRTYGVTLSLTW